MPDNFLTYFTNALGELWGSQGAFFQALGQQLFLKSVMLAVALFIISTLLFGFDRHELRRLVFTIVVCQLMITYYTTPSPLWGSSVTGLITGETSYLAERLESAGNQNAQNALDAAYAAMETPGITSSVFNVVWYFGVVVVITALSVLLLAVVAFGIIAAGLLKLFGVTLISSLLWPGLEWLFHGWLRSFIQYSMYQPMAAGVVFLAGQVLIQFRVAHPYIRLAEIPSLGIIFIGLLGSLIYIITRVPSLVSSVSRGGSGESFFSRG